MVEAVPFEVPDQWKTNSRIISDKIFEIVNRTGNLAPILPLLFRYNGQPVSLEEHYPFEICFYHKRPRRLLKRCGRQVGKSFQNALELILRGVMIPNWNILYVTPLFEQVRRFSTQYVSALIEESVCKRLMTLKGASKQVLQRTLGSRSTLYFTYAQRDANRARGINANEVMYDEVQLMSSDVFPVLQQVMGGSKWGIYESFAGTPLSRGNILERYFNLSTMSEWMIPCRHCGYQNVAAYDYDLMGMIGPVHEFIHPGGPDPKTGAMRKRIPGLICARCSPRSGRPENLKNIFPEDGRWWHRVPERRNDFVGIHIPQPITTRHAYSQNRWQELNNRIAVGSDFEIFNEILGESCDSGFKPISEADLKKAACLGHKNTVADALRVAPHYARLAMGIDWGGGGISGISRTKAAICGLTANGKTDVIFGVDLNFCHNPFEEVKALMVLAMKFGVELIAHDAGGGVGSAREALMYQTRTLNAEIWPMSYHGPMSNALMRYSTPQEGETGTWTVDKARSLTYLCQAMRQGHVRTFDYDYESSDNPGLLHDFTALMSEIQHNPRTSDILLIDREDGLSDDFVHAVNFAMLGLWSKHDCFPNLNLSLVAASVQELANTTHMIRDSQNWSAEDIEHMLQVLKA